MREAVIVSAVRTAVGRGVKGSLKDTRPDDLAGLVIREAVERAGIDKKEVEDVILGCAMPEASQGMNVSRLAAFIAGMPVESSAMTINRFCSSGLEAIAQAAQKVMCGWVDVAVAGGVESMSMVPMGGFRPSPNPDLVESYPESYTPMGLTAENVASKFNVTREMQDEFACQSHEKALKALKAGAFKDEIVPVKTRVSAPDPETGDLKFRDIVFDADECPRAGTTVEGLAQLKPAFKLGGSVTAGNSSPLNDGAAAAVVMSAEKAKALKVKPLAYFRCYATVGVPPEIMGIGPAEAIPKLLRKAGLDLKDIDLYEINEAFAVQARYCVEKVGIDPKLVNVNGGAIALGHPLGCTGAKLSAQLIHEMGRRKSKYGIVSMCIGGGMGAAGLFELAG